eukprot:SAG22_NODE_11161_length_497_cov_1.728643_1_plen_38_part_10
MTYREMQKLGAGVTVNGLLVGPDVFTADVLTDTPFCGS